MGKRTSEVRRDFDFACHRSEPSPCSRLGPSIPLILHDDDSTRASLRKCSGPERQSLTGNDSVELQRFGHALCCIARSVTVGYDDLRREVVAVGASPLEM